MEIGYIDRDVDRSIDIGIDMNMDMYMDMHIDIKQLFTEVRINISTFHLH